MRTIEHEVQQTYVSECIEHLAIMESNLIALELGVKNADAEKVRRLLRAAHSVRTCAQFCGIARIGELAERVDRTLAPLHFDRMTLTPSRVTVLLRATDIMRALLDGAGEEGAIDLSEIMASLGALGGRDAAATRHRPGWQPRTLLVEDDFTSRLLLQTFLARYGECHIAVNGREAGSGVPHGAGTAPDI
ncbi:MAG: Hpt domain-containing protein [Ignavibacteriota bacterium]